MTGKSKRGINKRFMAQLFQKYGFLEFRAKNAVEIWKEGRNDTGFENEDAGSDLHRSVNANLLIKEIRGIYRFNPCSDFLPKVISSKTTRKLRKSQKGLKLTAIGF